MSTTTVPDGSDTTSAQMLIVRTQVVKATVDELRGTILAVFANQPHEDLRDEGLRPELVLQALPARDLFEAEALAACMRRAHRTKIPHEQRVKIVRLADATLAELAAIERIPANKEPDNLAVVFAELVPDLPIRFAGILAARLHESGYRVVAPVAGTAGVR